jgi:HlyD family secretion protein
VRANAFKEQTFAGKVRRIAQFAGPSRLNAQPARGKLNDVDVIEVMIELTNPGPLTVGMDVDVYFQPGGLDRSSSE